MLPTNGAPTDGAPIILWLHQDNSDAASALSESGHGNVADMAKDHIVVTVEGQNTIDDQTGRDWSPTFDGSFARTGVDDVQFLGTTLIEHLAAHSNVKAQFKFLGQGLGGSLLYNLLAQNTDGRITHVAIDSAVLMTMPAQVSESGGNYAWHTPVGVLAASYTGTVAMPKLISPRRKVFIFGVAAEIRLTMNDGAAAATGEKFSTATYLNWHATAFAVAQLYGYPDAQLTADTTTNPNTHTVDYSLQTNGVPVKAYYYSTQSGHAVARRNFAAQNVEDFMLSDAEPPGPPNPPSPPASSPPPPASSPPPPPGPPLNPDLRITKGVGLADASHGIVSPKYSVRMKQITNGEWEDAFVFYNPSGDFYDNKERVAGTNNIANAGHKTGYFISLTGSTNSWITYEVPVDVEYEIEITKTAGAIHKVEAIPNNRAVSSRIVDGKAIVRVMGNQYFYVDIDGQMNDQNTAGWAAPVNQLTGLPTSPDAPKDASGNIIPLKDWPFHVSTHTFHVLGSPPWAVASPHLPYRPTLADCDDASSDWHCVHPGETWNKDWKADTGKEKVYFTPGLHEPEPIPACCSRSPGGDEYGPLIGKWSPAAEAAMQSGELCYCDKGGHSGGNNGAQLPILTYNVKPLYVDPDTTFFVDENAWIDGGISTGNGDGTTPNNQYNINLLGYGHISGRKYQNRLSNNNNAVKVRCVLSHDATFFDAFVVSV